MVAIFYILMGGGLGAVCRYGLQTSMNLLAPTFPYGTLAANLIGCFLAGFIAPAMLEVRPEVRLFVMTGFLGALTTLSGFSLEVLVMGDEKRLVAAGVYWALNAIFCIAVCLFGVFLSSRT